MADVSVNVETAVAVLDLLIFERTMKPYQMNFIDDAPVLERLEPARRIANKSLPGALRRAHNDGANWGFYQGMGVSSKIPFDPKVEYPLNINKDAVNEYLSGLIREAIPDRSKKVPKRLIHALINRAWAVGVIMGFGQANRQIAISQYVERAHTKREADWTSHYMNSLFEGDYGSKPKDGTYPPKVASESTVEDFFDMLTDLEDAA